MCLVWAHWLLFFCVLVQKGRILRDTGRILRISYPESPDLYPESPGPANRYTFYWVDNMSYASHLSLHSLVHPTVKHIRAFVVLLIYMPKLLICQVKIEIQSSWHILRGSSYMLDVYHFMLIKWATCGLSSITKKGGDWKWSRPLGGFWWIMTKHMYI